MGEIGSLAELDKAIRDEADRLLREEKFWSFGAFGWLNENDPDPEFIGLAMWQTDAAGDPYLYFGMSSSSSKRPPPPDPEEWRQRIAVVGTDLDGMMDAARASIGLFLVQAQLRRDNQLTDERLYDLYQMNSIIHLATASERLRELFIASVFRQSGDAYHDNNRDKGKFHGPDKVRKRREYATPFIEACHVVKPDHAALAAQFDSLPARAEAIQTFRDQRNDIIHKIATSMARSQHEQLKNGSWKEPMTTDMEWDVIEESIKISAVDHQKRIEEAITELREWYMLLVRASNDVCYIEYHLRRPQTRQAEA